MSLGTSELDKFMTKFSPVTENYTFYNGEVNLVYDVTNHIYLLVTPDGLVPQNGSSSVGQIIDKSKMLVPWSAKMMGEKLLSLIPNQEALSGLTYQEFSSLVLKSKSSHKDKLDDAGKVGNLAHNWIERYIKAVLEVSKEDWRDVFKDKPAEPRALSCVNAALKWMDDHDVVWRATERKIYSRKYKYAGTLDGLARVSSCRDKKCCKDFFESRLSVIDWKSSNALHIEYIGQTASYKQAYQEETGEDVTDVFIIRLGKEDGVFDPWHRTKEDFEVDFSFFLDALALTRSCKQLEDELANGKKRISDAKKEEKKLDKQLQEKVKCKKADTYKGVRKPTCGCQTCEQTYKEHQAKKKYDKQREY